MKIPLDNRSFDPEIDINGPQGDDLFAFLDQHLADMLTLFIYRIMLECGLTHGESGSSMESLTIKKMWIPAPASCKPPETA